MDETLAEHIRFTAEKGLSREEIKSMLLESGWPAKQVNQYIEKTFKHLEKGIILRAHSISKRFGSNQVLQGVEFDVRSGEIFGLIGMSGAGKTTLLNIMTGFLKPDQGDIILAKETGPVSIIANPQLIKTKAGFSTQTPSFYPKLTVQENLEHFGRLYGLAPRDLTRRCNALLDLADLTSARHVQASHLSGGMQKRLDIACALLHDPDILILDEPTADLDPILRKQLWSLIKKINAKGTTIILASHFLAEIELLCDRIAILQGKRILELGTAQELRDIYSKNFEIFLQTDDKNYQPILSGLQTRKKYFALVTEEEGELVIQTPFPERVLSGLSQTLERREGSIQSLHVARPTLGRVFESLIKK